MQSICILLWCTDLRIFLKDFFKIIMDSTSLSMQNNNILKDVLVKEGKSTAIYQFDDALDQSLNTDNNSNSNSTTTEDSEEKHTPESVSISKMQARVAIKASSHASMSMSTSKKSSSSPSGSNNETSSTSKRKFENFLNDDDDKLKIVKTEDLNY